MSELPAHLADGWHLHLPSSRLSYYIRTGGTWGGWGGCAGRIPPPPQFGRSFNPILTGYGGLKIMPNPITTSEF